MNSCALATVRRIVPSGVLRSIWGRNTIGSIYRGRNPPRAIGSRTQPTTKIQPSLQSHSSSRFATNRRSQHITRTRSFETIPSLQSILGDQLTTVTKPVMGPKFLPFAQFLPNPSRLQSGPKGHPYGRLV